MLIKLGGKKVQVVLYMMDKKNKENIFFGNYQTIAQETQTSIPTVMKVVQSLLEEKVIQKLQNGV